MMVRARRGLSPSIVRRGLSSSVRLNCSEEGSIILGDSAITTCYWAGTPSVVVVDDFSARRTTDKSKLVMLRRDADGLTGSTVRLSYNRKVVLKNTGFVVRCRSI